MRATWQERIDEKVALGQVQHTGAPERTKAKTFEPGAFREIREARSRASRSGWTRANCSHGIRQQSARPRQTDANSVELGGQ